MINSMHSENHNDFYENQYLNKLVDLSLDNLDNDVFLNIITLIKLPNLESVKKSIPYVKLDPECLDVTVYDEIFNLFKEIYAENYFSNLRGVFLELLTFKFINKKYNPMKSDFDCYVMVDEIKSERTVDVFALCADFRGIICECKISHNNFKYYNLSNLNNLFNNSNKILIPYIITLSTEELIMDKLINIVREHSTNVDVYLGHIKIISNTNISDFFR